METELTTATQIIASGGIDIFETICISWFAVEFIKGWWSWIMTKED